MKRSALFAVVALLAFAACASDKTDKSGAGTSTSRKAPSSSSSPPTTTKDAAKAIATARRLGCAKITQSADRDRLGLPTPIASVSCAAKGVRYRIESYAKAADLERLKSAASTKLRCGLLKALGGKGPIYTVYGADFSATAAGKAGAKDGLQQATALGAKLKLPVTTTTCPA